MSVLILPPRETPALWSQTPRQRKCTACQTHWVRKAGYTYTNWPSRRKESKRQVLSVNHVLHHPVRKYRAPLGFGVNIRTRSIFTNRAVYFYERMRISLYTATKTRGPFRATVAEAGFYDRGCMTADRHIYTHDFPYSSKQPTYYTQVDGSDQHPAARVPDSYTIFKPYASTFSGPNLPTYTTSRPSGFPNVRRFRTSALLRKKKGGREMARGSRRTEHRQ